MTLNLAISSPSQRGMPDMSSRRFAVGKFLSDYGGFGGQGRLLILMGLLGGLGGAFISFILILYFDALGFSPVFFGTIMLINEASMAVMLLPAGFLSRRLGTKVPVMSGAALAALANSIYLMAPDKTIYMGAAVMTGVASALFSPAYQAMLAGRTDEKKRKYFFSLQSFVSMIGFSIAILVAGAIPDLAKNITSDGMFGYRLAIGIGVVFFTLQFATSVLVKGEKGTKGQNKEAEQKVSITARFRRSRDAKNILKFALPAMMIGMGAGILIPFFQLQFKLRFDMVPTQIGIVFAFTQITMAAAILILPRVADRIGSVRLIVGAEGLATISLVMMPIVVIFPSLAFELFLALYVVRTILMNMSGPVSNAFTMSRVSPGNRALTTSVITVSWIGTHAVGSFIGGYIIGISLDLPFYICAAFYGLATLTYYLFFRKMDDAPGDQSRETEPSVV